MEVGPARPVAASWRGAIAATLESGIPLYEIDSWVGTRLLSTFDESGRSAGVLHLDDAESSSWADGIEALTSLDERTVGRRGSSRSPLQLAVIADGVHVSLQGRPTGNAYSYEGQVGDLWIAVKVPAGRELVTPLHLSLRGDVLAPLLSRHLVIDRLRESRGT